MIKVVWSLRSYLNFLYKYTARRLFLYFPFFSVVEKLNTTVLEWPQRWHECIHRILWTGAVRRLWRLCGLSGCCLAARPGLYVQWRLCILGRSAAPGPAGVKVWPDEADKTSSASKRETRPRSTNRARYVAGRQNKQDTDGARCPVWQARTSLGANPAAAASEIDWLKKTGPHRVKHLGDSLSKKRP